MTKLTTGDHAPDFSLPDAGGNTVSLADFKGKPLVLVFSRYVGCPVCQMTTVELTRAAPEFERAGAALAIVFQSGPERLAAFAQRQGQGAALLGDPEGRSYAAYGVEASLAGYLAPGNLPVLFRAVRQGFGHGAFEGRETQQPAAFVIDGNGQIRQAHYGRNITDLPDPNVLLSEARALSASQTA
ncbi:MAG: peroxiredoxin-like family protein [Pseudomonadota bacterium]|nr:peroxiredoxin-like family protein [Pseudomonadota bacterium]